MSSGKEIAFEFNNRDFAVKTMTRVFSIFLSDARTVVSKGFFDCAFLFFFEIALAKTSIIKDIN